MTAEQALIEQLQKEKRVAEELLFLVLDHIGEPVVLDLEESRKKSMKDHAINLDMDEENGLWIVSAVRIDA